MPDSPPALHRAAIALGSNLPSSFGSREDTLHHAIERLSALGRLTAVSAFFDTAPVGLVDQPRFLNAAALLETNLTAPNLMHALLALEQQMGRVRSADVPPKGPRVLDLDLLLLDDLVLATPALTLPHPAMHQRRFVLEPLAQIAPLWPHPVLHQTVTQLLLSLLGTPATSHPDPEP